MDKKKILIIEDNSDFAMMCSFALKRAGYLTSIALSAEQAFKEIHDQALRLIMMDLTLPDFLPEEFLKKIRSLPNIKDIPVILVSGREEIESICQELGCQGYLKKPFDFAKLLGLVAKLLKTS